MKVTDKYIEKLLPDAKRYTLSLGESLFLRVFPSGSKSYVLRCAIGGRVRDFTLGKAPTMTLKQAKQAAHMKRAELKVKPSRGLTLTDAFKLWKAKKRGKIASYTDECQRIEKHLILTFGSTPLDTITAPLIFTHLLKLQTKLPTLRRVLMRLNEMLDLSVYAGLLPDNPCKRLSRAFASHQVTNRPFIPASRLHELFFEAKESPEWFRCLLLWAVYSMLRPIECVSIRWDWIEGNTLTLPAEIMKKRRQHRVPLCPEVLSLLEHTRKLKKGRRIHVWAFGRGGAVVSKQCISKWINTTSLKGQLCHHGLRATGRTWMRDEGVIHEVAEDALAHLSGSVTERAYLRGDYLEQRREVMQRWWNYIYAEYCKVCAPLIC